jgi:hypothetical protein
VPRNFPNWIKGYMEYTRDSESPSSFHFWTAVSTLAGALRRRVWLDMRKFAWTPNFYIILVAPPGITAKTTSIGMGYGLLSKVDGINFGPKSLTWQALVDTLRDASEGVMYTDVNGQDTIIPQSAISVFVGELGTFMSMEDDKFISFLIEMWEGQLSSFTHKTRGSGATTIINPWLNIIGCTTPTWITTNFSESMVGGGLVSRCVFIFGEKKRTLIPYPDEVIPAREYYELETKLVEDLREIARISGPYLLSNQARDWGRRWYKNHWTARPAHMASERYGGYIARKQTHIHKLGIVLAAAKRDQLIIEEEDLTEAETHISSIEPDMIRVFESIGVASEATYIQEIVTQVRHRGWMTSDELWKICMQTMPQRYFEEALKGAVRGGLLTIQTKDGRKGVICPDIQNQTAQGATVLTFPNGTSKN